MKRWFLVLLVVCAACDSASPLDVPEPEPTVVCEGETGACTETGSLTLEILVVTVTPVTPSAPGR